jgi:hypothetical protein
MDFLPKGPGFAIGHAEQFPPLIFPFPCQARIDQPLLAVAKNG